MNPMRLPDERRHARRRIVVASVIALAIVAAMLFIAGHYYYKDRARNPSDESRITSHESRLYHCPMHPNYTSDKPGTCPICGMTLVPVESDDAVGHEGMDHEGMKGAETIPGRAQIKVTDFERQLIGVTFATVEKKELVREIRTVAMVAFDPDLATAQREYLEARRVGDRTLAAAAADRLELMGMSRAQIAELGKGGRVQKNLYLPAKDGRVWIYTTIYEPDISRVAVGQEVRVTTPDAPERVFTGRIAAIDSVVDAKSRTLRVRSEVDDPAGILKPDRYADAYIRIPLGISLAIPASALLWSGEGNYAFVDKGDGMLDPRKVKAGARAGDDVQILEGLGEGERVVSSANFLIDSESALKAAVKEFSGKKSGGHEQMH